MTDTEPLMKNIRTIMLISPLIESAGDVEFTQSLGTCHASFVVTTVYGDRVRVDLTDLSCDVPTPATAVEPPPVLDQELPFPA